MIGGAGKSMKQINVMFQRASKINCWINSSKPWKSHVTVCVLTFAYAFQPHIFANSLCECDVIEWTIFFCMAFFLRHFANECFFHFFFQWTIQSVSVLHCALVNRLKILFIHFHMISFSLRSMLFNIIICHFICVVCVHLWCALFFSLLRASGVCAIVSSFISNFVVFHHFFGSSFSSFVNLLCARVFVIIANCYCHTLNVPAFRNSMRYKYPLRSLLAHTVSKCNMYSQFHHKKMFTFSCLLLEFAQPFLLSLLCVCVCSCARWNWYWLPSSFHIVWAVIRKKTRAMLFAFFTRINSKNFTLL